MVPHELPGRERLGEMIADLPLEVVSFDDEEEYYCAVLHIPEGYRIRGGPLQLQVRPSLRILYARVPSRAARLPQEAHEGLSERSHFEEFHRGSLSARC